LKDFTGIPFAYCVLRISVVGQPLLSYWPLKPHHPHKVSSSRVVLTVMAMYPPLWFEGVDILEVDLYIPSKGRARGWTLGVFQSLDGNA
jgi:hypothetical protein